jgi:hypothetical protein
MNPLWFFVGLEVGERVREELPTLIRQGKRVARESYWFVEGEVEKFRAGAAYRRWLDSLPTTEGK